jgi:hypothetical protein
MNRRMFSFVVTFACLTWLSTGVAMAQDPMPPAESLEKAFKPQKHYSPYAGRNFPTQVFWGDTHLHTGMSMDAGAFGARLGPEDAYRFARGEELTSSTGLQVKLGRPLDFLVVADHSDNMGFFPRLFAGDGGRRDHYCLLTGDLPSGTRVTSGYRGLPFRLGRDHRGG